MSNKTKKRLDCHSSDQIVTENTGGDAERSRLRFPRPVRYIGLKEMCELTGKSHSTLWKMWSKRGDFPKPYRTKHGLFLGWPVDVYEKWVMECDPENKT
ncbi:MAG: helix-turn-helix transcriptional regulator [Enterobacteriaceae bacterium]